ncbi:MAG: helix-turn-helix domain-containing protein [Gallionella sp.]
MAVGKSQAQLARELGVSGGVINNVIHDRITSFAVATYIANLLNSKVDELWPDRYVFKPRGRAAHKNMQTGHETNGGLT